MSLVTQYGVVVDREKQPNCISCNKKFDATDHVVLCDFNHIFHKRCWKGDCSTESCKSSQEFENKRYRKDREGILALRFGTALALILVANVIYERFMGPR